MPRSMIHLPEGGSWIVDRGTPTIHPLGVDRGSWIVVEHRSTALEPMRKTKKAVYYGKGLYNAGRQEHGEAHADHDAANVFSDIGGLHVRTSRRRRRVEEGVCLTELTVGSAGRRRLQAVRSTLHSFSISSVISASTLPPANSIHCCCFGNIYYMWL